MGLIVVLAVDLVAMAVAFKLCAWAHRMSFAELWRYVMRID